MHSAERPVMVVFSENDFDREFLKESLDQYFAQYLEIVPLSSATRSTFTDTPKAVVANIVALDSARRLFPDSRVIYTQRLVSGYRLEQVLELPPGTPVLVANRPIAMAIETIQNLTDLGINHIRMQPYCHGMGIDTTGYETAIYTGTRAYCPEGLHCLNIGYRSLSQSTLAEIMKTYDLPFDALEIAYHQHAKLIVHDLYRIQNAFQAATRQQKNFEQVCMLSTNALINLDESECIVVCNPAAESLLGLQAGQVRGQHYRTALRPFESLRKMIARGVDVTDSMLYIRNHAALATMRCIEQENGRQLFLSLAPVESLLSTEEKARANIHRRGFVAKYTFEDIKGAAPALRQSLTLAHYYAQADATVLITGESGTGKELFAQSIHNASPRAKGPFVGVNFAALPETLIESELFGYDDGAFTGARKGGKTGLFRSAHHGTIFLDEIGDVSLAMQSRLLRVLEEREIMPVGSSRVIPVDVRIICATNKNLPHMVAQGRFREDLYYRLKVFTLHVPPLRERRADIPVILEAMTGMALPDALRGRFLSYSWPGNIRELKSIAQHFTLFSELPAPGSAEDRIWQDILASFFRDMPAGEPSAPEDTPQDDGLSESDVLLLQCIDEMNRSGQSAGRYSLARHPQLHARGLTEARIKLRLSQLKARGLLLSGKTRQGVTLSDSGRARLQQQ